MSVATNNDEIGTFQRFEFFFGIIHRILIGFVTIFISWLCLRKRTWTDVPWHAFLCTIGFNFLMAEGLISYYKGNPTIYGCCRNGKIGLHIALQLIGSILGIAGIVIRMGIDDTHFTTLHGQLGLAALVLCVLSLIFGCSALFSIKMKNCIQPILNKAVHGILGTATYTFAIVSLFYGFDTYVFAQIAPTEHQNWYTETKIILKIATLGSLILTIYGPFTTAVKRFWNFCNK